MVESRKAALSSALEVIFGLAIRRGRSKGHPEGHDFCLQSFRSNHLRLGFTKAAQCYWGLDTTFKDVHIQGCN